MTTCCLIKELMYTKMGCNASNTRNRIPGGSTSPADTDPPKSAAKISLTELERQNIRNSWKSISSPLEKAIITLFYRLFDNNEEIRQMFGSLRFSKPAAELRESRILESHVNFVLFTLEEAVTSLDDMDFVVKMLHKVGRIHKRFINFKPDLFWEIEEPFLRSVKDSLGDEFKENTEQVYRTIIRFILSALVEGFES